MYRLVVIDDEYIVVQGIKALISRLKLDISSIPTPSSSIVKIILFCSCQPRREIFPFPIFGSRP